MKATKKDRAEVDLELFKKDSCPYCQRVMGTIHRLNVPMTLRDTQLEPDANAELIERGGKRQVPCLFIDGEPLYESADIDAWLQEAFG